MYLIHFGFTELPFSNTPDPRFVYLSSRHEEALAHLLYGVRERGGFVQLTGEVGTGKTTTCRYLLSQLPEGVDVALVLNPMLTPEELLATVCDELGAAYPPEARTRKAFVDALYHHLLAAHARGRRTVLIVDEAQNLSADALEQLRLLTNLETATDKLLQIILIGQPELTVLLARTLLRQVAQRITARYHLLPFAERDTRAYIARRLQIAGQGLNVFEPAAVLAVHRASRGVPRLVNVICDRALLGAFAEGRRTVSADIVRRAAREVAGETAGVAVQRRVGRAAATAAALALVVIAVSGWAGVWNVPSLRALRNIRLTAAPDVSVPRMAAATTSLDASPGGTAVAAASVPTTPAGGPWPRPDLAALLARSGPVTDPAGPQTRVLASWGVTVMPGEAPCQAATRAGLECYEVRGTWTVVRRLGVPVVVKLLRADGGRHYVAVTALEADTVTLLLGDRAEVVPIAAVDAMWDGVFWLIWRPLPGVARVLSPGMQGPGVAWLRRALSDGEAAGPADRGPALYDEALAARVVAFQRREGLEADGVAGIETLVRLSTRLDRRAPSLASAGTVK
jgi:general secretion pathway protein A